MQIFINGKPLHATEGSTLSDLLAMLGIDPQTCATAVNGVFVARDARASHALAEHDQVMTFEPITGG